MSLEVIRNRILLGYIALLVLFNYGFMQLRFPFGGVFGLPLAELLLLGSLMTFNLKHLLARLSQLMPLTWVFGWWGFGFARLLYDATLYGFWAFRDASHVIESLFLLVGFGVAAKVSTLETMVRWLPWFFLALGLYVLTYPFGPALAQFSPSLASTVGTSVPLFFKYTNTASMAVVAIFYLLLWTSYRGWVSARNMLIATFLFVFAVFFFQARTTYTQFLTVSAFILCYRPRLILRIAPMLLGLLGIAILVGLVGLEIKGRLGQSAGIEFLWNHFLAIFGIANEGLEGSAGGVNQRLVWWGLIFKNVVSSPTSLLLGLGYGEPLVDFGIVREPHNSFVSILGRLGLIGTVLFFGVQFQLFRLWRQAMILCKQRQFRWGQNLLLLMGVFTLMVWVGAVGEDMFEKPFYAIPYYFFWGVTLRLCWHLKQGHLPVASPPSVMTFPKPELEPRPQVAVQGER